MARSTASSKRRSPERRSILVPISLPFPSMMILTAVSGEGLW
jgi:hypothetical protein